MLARQHYRCTTNKYISSSRKAANCNGIRKIILSRIKTVMAFLINSVEDKNCNGHIPNFPLFWAPKGKSWKRAFPLTVLVFQYRKINIYPEPRILYSNKISNLESETCIPIQESIFRCCCCCYCSCCRGLVKTQLPWNKLILGHTRPGR